MMQTIPIVIDEVAYDMRVSCVAVPNELVELYKQKRISEGYRYSHTVGLVHTYTRKLGDMWRIDATLPDYTLLISERLVAW